MPGHSLILALGSNCGDRARYLRQAVAALQTHPDIQLQACRISPMYETPALLPDGAPEAWNQSFLNAVVAGQSFQEDAIRLLAATQSIEQRLGRQIRGHWGPREIDIDLLDMDGQVMDVPSLQLPHPAMLERAFVMVPLANLLPTWQHPVSGVTAQEAVTALAHDTAMIRMIEEVW